MQRSRWTVDTSRVTVLVLVPFVTSCTLIASSLLPEGGGGSGSTGGAEPSGGATTGGGGADGGGGSAAGGDGGAGQGGAAPCEAPHACLEIGGGQPVLLSRHPFPSAASLCADGGFATPRYFLPATTASCACSCGPWSGASCDEPSVSCFASASCSGAVLGLAFEPGNCLPIPNQYDTLSCRLVGDAQVAAPGACTPSAADLTPGTFDSQIDACPAAVALGCQDEHACVPNGACVAFEGDVPCPPHLPERALTHAGADDQRTCSACACDASASCSGGSLVLHDNDDCTDDAAPAVVDSATCVDVSPLMDDNSGAGALVPAVLTGSCTSSGGVGSGSVSPTGPSTLCCPLGGLP